MGTEHHPLRPRPRDVSLIDGVLMRKPSLSYRPKLSWLNGLSCVAPRPCFSKKIFVIDFVGDGGGGGGAVSYTHLTLPTKA